MGYHVFTDREYRQLNLIKLGLVIAGMLAGVIMTISVLPDPVSPECDISYFTEQLERDDRILTRILGSWDRKKPLYCLSFIDMRNKVVFHYTQDLNKDEVLRHKL